MGTVIGIGILCLFVWWAIKGRRSTMAIVNNALIALFFGAIGVLLIIVGSGFAVVIGIAALLYALYGAYQTLPWIIERLDPDGK